LSKDKPARRLPCINFKLMKKKKTRGSRSTNLVETEGASSKRQGEGGRGGGGMDGRNLENTLITNGFSFHKKRTTN